MILTEVTREDKILLGDLAHLYLRETDRFLIIGRELERSFSAPYGLDYVQYYPKSHEGWIRIYCKGKENGVVSHEYSSLWKIDLEAKTFSVDLERTTKFGHPPHEHCDRIVVKNLDVIARYFEQLDISRRPLAIPNTPLGNLALCHIRSEWRPVYENFPLKFPLPSGTDGYIVLGCSNNFTIMVGEEYSQKLCTGDIQMLNLYSVPLEQVPLWVREEQETDFTKKLTR